MLPSAPGGDAAMSAGSHQGPCVHSALPPVMDHSCSLSQNGLEPSTPSVVLGPVASASPGSLLEMKDISATQTY